MFNFYWEDDTAILTKLMKKTSNLDPGRISCYKHFSMGPSYLLNQVKMGDVNHEYLSDFICYLQNISVVKIRWARVLVPFQGIDLAEELTIVQFFFSKIQRREIGDNFLFHSMTSSWLVLGKRSDFGLSLREPRHVRNPVHFLKKPRESSRIPSDSVWIPHISENPHNLDSTDDRL